MLLTFYIMSKTSRLFKSFLLLDIIPKMLIGFRLQRANQPLFLLAMDAVEYSLFWRRNNPTTKNDLK